MRATALLFLLVSLVAISHAHDQHELTFWDVVKLANRRVREERDQGKDIKYGHILDEFISGMRKARGSEGNGEGRKEVLKDFLKKVGLGKQLAQEIANGADPAETILNHLQKLAARRFPEEQETEQGE